MKLIYSLIASLIFFSAMGVAQAAESGASDQKQEYIPWTWDDIAD